MKNTLHINMPPDLKKAVKARAALLGIPASRYVSRLVVELLSVVEVGPARTLNFSK